GQRTARGRRLLERGAFVCGQGLERRGSDPTAFARRERAPAPALGEQLVAVVGTRRTRPRLDEPLPVPLERVGPGFVVVPGVGLVGGPDRSTAGASPLEQLDQEPP